MGPSYKYSCYLVQDSQLRQSIPDQYKRRIEHLVRKGGKEFKNLDSGESTTINPLDDLIQKSQAQSPCVFCKNPIPVTQEQCQYCNQLHPWCVYTGLKMELDDYSQCPRCKFPQKWTSLCQSQNQYQQEQGVQPMNQNCECPMCGECFAGHEATHVVGRGVEKSLRHWTSLVSGPH